MVMKTLILVKNAKMLFEICRLWTRRVYIYIYYSFYANDLSQTKNLNFNKLYINKPFTVTSECKRHRIYRNNTFHQTSNQKSLVEI